MFHVERGAGAPAHPPVGPSGSLEPGGGARPVRVLREPSTLRAMERLAGRRVVVAGLFSAKLPDPEARLEHLAGRVRAGSGTVVGQVLQRRGVSRARRPGGVQRLEQPLSKKTLLGSGKARELAVLCQTTGADLVLFWNPLTPRQRETLEGLTGVDVRDAASLGFG
jgi:hypothetical protein